MGACLTSLRCTVNILLFFLTRNSIFIVPLPIVLRGNPGEIPWILFSSLMLCQWKVRCQWLGPLLSRDIMNDICMGFTKNVIISMHWSKTCCIVCVGGQCHPTKSKENTAQRDSVYCVGDKIGGLCLCHMRRHCPYSGSGPQLCRCRSQSMQQVPWTYIKCMVSFCCQRPCISQHGTYHWLWQSVWFAREDALAIINTQQIHHKITNMVVDLDMLWSSLGWYQDHEGYQSRYANLTCQSTH